MQFAHAHAWTSLFEARQRQEVVDSPVPVVGTGYTRYPYRRGAGHTALVVLVASTGQQVAAVGVGWLNQVLMPGLGRVQWE